MALLDNEQGGLLSGAMNPAAQGLLAAGLGLLAGARSGNPAGALGAGGLAGLQAFQQAQAAGDMQAYRQAQAQKLQQEAKKNEVVLGLLSRLGGGQAQGGQTPVDVQSVGPLLAGATPAASPGLLGGAASAGQSAASSGGFNLSLPEVAALKMAGVDLTDLYKISREGFKREPGAAYVLPDGTTNYGPPKLPEGMELGVGPDGRVVARLVAGYNDANAAAKGAEAGAIAGAQAGYDLVDVPDGNGGTVKMSRAAALQRLGGTPGTGGNAGAPAQPDRFGRSSSPADQAFEESVAKASADTYNTLQKAGLNADKQIADYQRIGALLDGFNGSSLTSVGMAGAKLLNSIGLEIDPNLGAKEAAVAVGNQLALKLRDPANGGGMPGAMSDSDREFLLQSIPNITQTDEGRKLGIGYQIKVLERNKDVAQFARKWRHKYGRLDSLDPNGNDFATALAAWAAANPLFGGQ